MIAKELISEQIPVLHTSDSGQKALNLMDVYRVSHLPIVNHTEFLGLISDTDIYDINRTEEAIGNHSLSLFSPYIFSDQHIYEIIAMVSKLKLTVIPVLKRNKEYLGVITLSTLVHQFNRLLAVGQSGGIIVLELNLNDYSLSEIARIVESNDAKILSLYVSTPEESMKMNVTLKINRVEIAPILQSFERYNYTIKDTIMEDDEMYSMFDFRYEEFMKYLSM
ncbi:MAG: CBS domain-containing protein [Bacteroidales bacterium]|nr:CBS domain-containing protein [Bacteroidales bacterium]MCF8454414.1 CBS domain-containing protein [Bacteroidales bacterium]